MSILMPVQSTEDNTQQTLMIQTENKITLLVQSFVFTVIVLNFKTYVRMEGTLVHEFNDG